MLSEADRERIGAAVAQAEASTSGEIVCVLAQRTADYAATPLAWAAAAALLVPPLALALGLDLGALARLRGDWTAAHASALPGLQAGSLAAYALLQAALFAVVAGLVSLPPVRLWMTPGPVKTRRVREAAFGQLQAAALAAGPPRAAVVVFAALGEHRVQVLASEAAHSAIGQSVWDEAVAAALAGLKRRAPAEGFIEAVRLCGAALARHFPQQTADPNAAPDRPLEL